MAKFLVIRLSSIGDIILTTPVIRCLKNQYKESEIHFLVKKQFLPVIASNPYIDKIHCYENNLSTLLKTLKDEHFDYIRTHESAIEKRIGKSGLMRDKLKEANRVNAEMCNRYNLKCLLIDNDYNADDLASAVEELL